MIRTTLGFDSINLSNKKWANNSHKPQFGYVGNIWFLYVIH